MPGAAPRVTQPEAISVAADPAPEPVAEAAPEEPALVIEPPAAEEDEPLTLDAPMEEVAQADELLLDAPEPEPEPLIDEDLTAKRGWFGGRAEPEAAPAPAPRQGGGTLFERMSSIARGNAKAPGTDDDGDPLDIPRFLNRQNNQ